MITVQLISTSTSLTSMAFVGLGHARDFVNGGDSEQIAALGGDHGRHYKNQVNM